jgi:hypothetical protein
MAEEKDRPFLNVLTTSTQGWLVMEIGVFCQMRSSFLGGTKIGE